MAEATEIKAFARARAGTGGARSIRREGFHDLTKLVGKGKFLSTVFDLNIDGKTSLVIPRQVQVDPVKDLPVHVDFQRVTAKSRIRVKVPVRFINEGLSPGLKRGGVLNIVRHEVEVTCPADAIPAYFEFNLEGLEIGRSVHISAIRLPDGVRPTITNRDFTVATIAGHRVEEEVKPVPAEGEAAAAAPAGDAKAAGAKDAAAKAPAAGKGAAGKEAAKPAEKGKK
jgi:large subunit ribosomal protein L25